MLYNHKYTTFVSITPNPTKLKPNHMIGTQCPLWGDLEPGRIIGLYDTLLVDTH
jgi:hypothetical protein